MRSYRVLYRGASIATVAVPALALAAITGVPTAGAASGVRYVALGDPDSSGVGAGNHYASSGSCKRSASAYPVRWADSNTPASFTSVACSGATTSDVLSGQVSALSARTTLVSITIGGNDAGFSSILETCVLPWNSACVSAISNAESFIASQLPARLDRTFQTIHADAPSARIVVLDYPELYDLSKSSTCIGLSAPKRTAIDRGADQLDAVISAAAARNGDTFTDVLKDFAGHEICARAAGCTRRRGRSASPTTRQPAVKNSATSWPLARPQATRRDRSPGRGGTRPGPRTERGPPHAPAISLMPASVAFILARCSARRRWRIFDSLWGIASMARLMPLRAGRPHRLDESRAAALGCEDESPARGRVAEAADRPPEQAPGFVLTDR